MFTETEEVGHMPAMLSRSFCYGSASLGVAPSTFQDPPSIDRDPEAASDPAPWKDEDDNTSTVSTYAASVFSIQSLVSNATDLSQASGYSQMQIAAATKVLIDIFLNDEMLVPWYKCAIASTAIGPDKLQRNLYRLFKHYARDLGEEYVERLEYLASRLVAVRAHHLATRALLKSRRSEPAVV